MKIFKKWITGFLAIAVFMGCGASHTKAVIYELPYLDSVAKDDAYEVEKYMSGKDKDQFINRLDRDGHNAFLRAAKYGSIKSLRIMLDNGFEPNYKHNYDNVTALMLAAREGKIDCANLLLEYGADPTALDTCERNALFYAISGNHGTDIVKSLLDCDADGICTSQQDNNGHTPLMVAIEQKNYEAARYLLYNTPYLNLEACDKTTGCNALDIACKSAPGDVIKLIIEHSKHVEKSYPERTGLTSKLLSHTDATGSNALFYAVARNNGTDVLGLLIQNGVSASHQDNNGHTPLMAAIKHKNYDAALYLLNNEPNLNLEACDKTTGRNVLAMACESAPDSVVKRIIEHSECVERLYPKYEGLTKRLRSHTDATGSNALFYAVARNSGTNVLDLLIQNGVSASHQDNNGHTPLMAAIEQKNYEAARYLLRNTSCLNLEACDEATGRNVLAMACESAPADIVKLILEHSKRFERLCLTRTGFTSKLLSHLDANGHTPLMAAIKHKNYGAALYLLNNEPDLNLETCDKVTGRNVLAMACESAPADIVKLILEHRNCTQSIIDHTDVKGSTPLMHAAYKGNTDCVRLLLEHQAKPDVLDENKQDALFYTAAGTGNADIIKLLTEKGLDINRSDKHSHTPLDVAIEQKNNNFVCFFFADLLAKNDINQVTAYLISERYRDLFKTFNDKDGNNALLIAAEHGSAASLNALLKSGLNPDTPNRDGVTPLMRAAFNGDTTCTNLLLEHHADPNIQDKSNRNALFYAVKGNRGTHIVDLLVNHGAHADQQDIDGFTPLIEAIYRGNFAAARYLLTTRSLNPNLEACTKSSNENALSIACQSTCGDIVQLIFKHPMCTPKVIRNCDSRGADALFYAAMCGNHLAVLEFVVYYKMNPNTIITFQGQKHTALTIAAINGHHHIVDLLLRSDTITDHNKSMARSLSKESGLNDMTKIIDHYRDGPSLWDKFIYYDRDVPHAYLGW